MSIAVSTVVQPSKLLSLMTMVVCMTVLCAGTVVGLGFVGDSAPALRFVAAGICLLAAIQAFRSERKRKSYAIHVSGAGQIRLSVGDAKAEPVRLLPASVLWPVLLILHLQNAKQHTEMVIVLPDSAPSDGFRRLLVACRWVAMRGPDTSAARELRRIFELIVFRPVNSTSACVLRHNKGTGI